MHLKGTTINQNGEMIDMVVFNSTQDVEDYLLKKLEGLQNLPRSYLLIDSMNLLLNKVFKAIDKYSINAETEDDKKLCQELKEYIIIKAKEGTFAYCNKIATAEN